MTEESLVGEEWGALPGSLVWGVTVQRVKKRGEGGNRSKWSAPERGWGKRDRLTDRQTDARPQIPVRGVGTGNISQGTAHFSEEKQG